jgi:DUF4097 and DUF4098 domain-containing protein YvlB
MSGDIRTEHFATEGGVSLALRVPSGEILVRTGETNQTQVEIEALNDAAREVIDRTRIDGRARGDRFEVLVDVPQQRGFIKFSSPKFEVRIDCPDGAELEVRTASADLQARGEFGAVDVNGASGDVEIENVHGEARVKTASGDVSIDFVGDETNIQSVSGDIQIGQAVQALVVNSVSGDVHVREAAASVTSRSVSGDQQIESVVEGEVTAQAVSGDVVIGIRRGSKLWVDANSVSGDTSSELELSGDAPAGEGPLVEVRARTVSGDVRLVRA